MIDVIYLAAGQGKRARLGYPKQFARLGGKPIMIHALEILQSMKEIAQIIVVCPGRREGAPQMWMVEKTVLQYHITKAIFVEGGKTRQESVSCGLEYVNSEYVLVTEAVRPVISVAFVREIIRLEADFVTPISASVASVIEWGDGTEGSSWARSIPREKVGQVQMPQKYETCLLREAHRKAIGKGEYNMTDDAVLVMKMMDVYPEIVKGLEENIKITTPLDLEIAEAIHRSRYGKGE
jgi:2-C-methyl-D-erythritol 4-phosphate cytidylyltransferase